MERQQATAFLKGDGVDHFELLVLHVRPHRVHAHFIQGQLGHVLAKRWDAINDE